MTMPDAEGHTVHEGDTVAVALTHGRIKSCTVEKIKDQWGRPAAWCKYGGWLSSDRILRIKRASTPTRTITPTVTSTYSLTKEELNALLCQTFGHTFLDDGDPVTCERCDLPPCIAAPHTNDTTTTLCPGCGRGQGIKTNPSVQGPPYIPCPVCDPRS